MIIQNNYANPVVVAEQDFSNDSTEISSANYKDKVTNHFSNDCQSKGIKQGMMNIMMRQFMDKMYDSDCPYSVKADQEW